MASYYIWTIGCQMNKADSDRIATYLGQMGFQAAARAEDACLVVLNSCVVRQSAENRVVNKLGALKSLKGKNNPVLVLTGCMVGPRVDGLRRRFPHVDLFLRPQDFSGLARFLAESNMGSPASAAGWILPTALPSTFVPVVQGCNQSCSYCIVPSRRGKERSRPLEDVRAEVEELVRRGTREVVLLGQNVDSYGHDLPQKPDLARLLSELNEVDGLVRIRFLTSHPKYMSRRLIEAMACLEKVCEHLSLPFQAGDDVVLRAMRRTYTVEDYRALVASIRSAIPRIAMSTDVIVGFPGETEEQFHRTFNLLAELRFDTVHVAAYSPRPGTIAARKLEDDVNVEEKVRRREMVEQLQEGIAAEINAQFHGSIVEVLVEGRKQGKWWGRTRGDKLVFFADRDDHMGRLVNVTVEKTGAWSLQGSLSRRQPGIACPADSPALAVSQRQQTLA